MTIKTLCYSLLAVLTFLVINGCAGTHGAIVNYCYPVKHVVLDSAIAKVLKDNKTIRRDTSDYGGYNQGDYFILLVDRANGAYQYNFRYYGYSTLRQQDSLNTCMFLWAMYDPKKNGGWDKDFGYSKKVLHTELLRIIEEEFILKVDKEVGSKHQVTK